MEEESWQLQKGGSVRQHDVLPAYRKRIVGDIHLARSAATSGQSASAGLCQIKQAMTRPLKIVVDCGNGVAGASAPGILRAIGCEVIELFTEVDGRFPNHHPDPSKPENLRDILRALQETDAELGLLRDRKSVV